MSLALQIQAADCSVHRVCTELSIAVYRRVLAPRLGEPATAAAVCWAFLGVPRLECKARSTDPSPLPRRALSNGRALCNAVSQRAAQRWGTAVGQLPRCAGAWRQQGNYRGKQSLSPRCGAQATSAGAPVTSLHVSAVPMQFDAG